MKKSKPSKLELFFNKLNQKYLKNTTQSLPLKYMSKMRKISDENKGKIFILSERRYVSKSEC